MDPWFTGTALAMALLASPAPDLPLEIPDEQWRPLRQQVDPGLQRQLDAAIRAVPGWAQLVDEKRLAVGFVELSDPTNPRFAHLNGDHEMYAASLPKIAILLSAYHAVEDGELVLDDAVKQDLHDMIRVSSNPAATRLIDRIGLERIEETVRDPRYRFYDQARGGGLWVGKRYGKGGERRGDPVANLSHAATVTQICRFYWVLASGRAINPERSREMLECLADPGLHHKFVASYEDRAPWVKLFRKSGTFRDNHADSAIVWGDSSRRYILAAIVRNDDGEELLRELVAVVEEGVLRPHQRGENGPTGHPGSVAR